MLLGANGAGKSNLVSFFSMLNHMMTGAFQTYVAERGYAESFLYFGSKATREISAQLTFADGRAQDTYAFRLVHAAGDILIFAEESLTYQVYGHAAPYVMTLNPGGRESDLPAFVNRPTERAQDKKTAAIILNLLRTCRVFHFHDTSLNARVRGQGYLEDNRYLRSDGGNLAAFLYRLQQDSGTLAYYEKIERYIRQVMPQFGGFDLAPGAGNGQYISLNWRDSRRPQHLMGPHQLSDGSLRFMCLTALLLQPGLSGVVILDEPELGLHPAAIAHLAGMIKAASHHAQVIMATQSPRLVDEFDLEDVVIVERAVSAHSTVFSRKDPADLRAWLDAYSLSELWEKNVIGGLP